MCKMTVGYAHSSWLAASIKALTSTKQLPLCTYKESWHNNSIFKSEVTQTV